MNIHTPGDNTDPLRPVSYARARTGLDTKVIHRAIKEGFLPAVRVAGGKKYLIRESDIDKLFVPVVPTNNPQDVA